MSTEAVSPAAISEKNVNVVVERTPFYKTFSFWIIFIAVVILIVIGFVIFFNTTTPAGGYTLIGFYIFAIILLIIGVLIAVM